MLASATGQGGQLTKCGPLGQRAASPEQPIWSDAPSPPPGLLGRPDRVKAKPWPLTRDSVVKPLPRSAANGTWASLATDKPFADGLPFDLPLNILLPGWSQGPLLALSVGRSLNLPGHCQLSPGQTKSAHDLPLCTFTAAFPAQDLGGSESPAVDSEQNPGLSQLCPVEPRVTHHRAPTCPGDWNTDGRRWAHSAQASPLLAPPSQG